MIEAARTLGFAARFKTGYIYVPDRDGPTWLGGGATHAGCQIYVPGSGWVELVPSQAIPLFGTYWENREDGLGMDVEVNVKTAAAYP
jgi:transglutaminase-like putative cysteine protease